jgi:opacity protein-like surface antigen
MQHQLGRFLLVFLLLLSAAAPASGQGFGIGGRMAMIRGNAQADTSALRFLGGHLRARLSPKTAFELSIDRHREKNGDLTQRVVDYPLQATLILYPVRSTFSPYLLGGFGWYTHKVQDLTGDKVSDIVSTRRTGWHAGLGAEILAGRHIGVHADYRYTFLHFGGDSSSDSSLTDHIIPSYQGSMWTAGFTLYF